MLMFTVYHFVWLAICLLLIAAAAVYLHRQRPELRKVLGFACAVSVLSELTKTFSVIQLVPSAGGDMYPYMELQHLPLHLCSIQILFIFYTRFAKDSPAREALLAFMYPSCLVGAACALAMPTIFSTSIEPEEAFTHPLAYQFFLYHTMLVILGLYIPMSGQTEMRRKHYFSTLGILALLAFASLYLNSMFASPVYENDELISVEYTTNFFFTYGTPVGIELTELWHWYLYLGVLAALAAIVVALLYLPCLRRRETAGRARRTRRSGGGESAAG